jgi:16S rRNA (guanine(966)-N(2))-methyltransferase RsmD
MATTRITAGVWRGRAVETPPGLETRPTTSLVRQALFNILGDVGGAAVLDLYAGAGTVGFEALSRGAARVTFVERHRPTLGLVAQTAERLGCADRCRLVVADALSWVRGRPSDLAAADLAFVDAPYRDRGLLDVLDALGAESPPLVVCEHHRAATLPDAVGGLRRVREATYGATRLSFFRRADADAPAGRALNQRERG